MEKKKQPHHSVLRVVIVPLEHLIMTMSVYLQHPVLASTMGIHTSQEVK